MSRSRNHASPPRPPTRSAAVDASESRSARKGRTRQALLDETLALVSDRSFASLSLREVAKAAGIVPTAFYRHFASMEDLGVTVVEDSMRVLRKTLREGRRDLATRNAVPTVKSSVAILVTQVRENEEQFRFLIREQHGGVSEIRRAIDTELRLFVKELAIDLSRIPELAHWGADDLELAADLMVNVLLQAVAEMLEANRRDNGDDREVTARSERKLVMVILGMNSWRTSRQ
ncbi:TetR family transcriptional regulator [Williamsia phyllosphaerae]|uniref:TetR family transcriptional regulator n=1 Tax=Williamsia phyllosphaerae TaxID=885042 RepID=A0ABQ1V338_9NOCA|nr:TetR family transcriptional regulator [Williamsia phyllosphaerae]GGF32954.1 TetR family transcriptional regulator [Williamsia phyllosphaerae]